jgi:hypothetical protein
MKKQNTYTDRVYRNTTSSYDFNCNVNSVSCVRLYHLNAYIQIFHLGYSVRFRLELTLFPEMLYMVTFNVSDLKRQLIFKSLQTSSESMALHVHS